MNTEDFPITIREIVDTSVVDDFYQLYQCCDDHKALFIESTETLRGFIVRADSNDFIHGMVRGIIFVQEFLAVKCGDGLPEDQIDLLNLLWRNSPAQRETNEWITTVITALMQLQEVRDARDRGMPCEKEA